MLIRILRRSVLSYSLQCGQRGESVRYNEPEALDVYGDQINIVSCDDHLTYTQVNIRGY